MQQCDTLSRLKVFCFSFFLTFHGQRSTNCVKNSSNFGKGQHESECQVSVVFLLFVGVYPHLNYTLIDNNTSLFLARVVVKYVLYHITDAAIQAHLAGTADLLSTTMTQADSYEH